MLSKKVVVPGSVFAPSGNIAHLPPRFLRPSLQPRDRAECHLGHVRETTAQRFYQHGGVCPGRIPIPRDEVQREADGAHREGRDEVQRLRSRPPLLRRARHRLANGEVVGVIGQHRTDEEAERIETERVPVLSRSENMPNLCVDPLRRIGSAKSVGDKGEGEQSG